MRTTGTFDKRRFLERTWASRFFLIFYRFLHFLFFCCCVARNLHLRSVWAIMTDHDESSKSVFLINFGYKNIKILTALGPQACFVKKWKCSKANGQNRRRRTTKNKEFWTPRPPQSFFAKLDLVTWYGAQPAVDTRMQTKIRKKKNVKKALDEGQKRCGPPKRPQTCEKKIVFFEKSLKKRWKTLKSIEDLCENWTLRKRTFCTSQKSEPGVH